MTKPLDVLIVEDSEDDALLVLRALKKGGYDPQYQRVETAGALREALAQRGWDLVLSDYKLPQFDGLAALAIYKETGMDIPFIIVSGTIGEEVAVAAMKGGAHDYIMKDNLARLVPAVERELKESRVRQARKQAEQALRESEERYRNYVEKSFAGVYVVQDGRFVFLNKNAASFAGYSQEELIGRSSHSIVHPEDLSSTLEKARGMLRGKVTSPHEFRIITGDGQIRWILEMVTIIQYHGRKAILGNSMDITESKRAEASLRKVRELEKSILRSVPHGLFGVEQRIIFFANDAMEAVFGWKPDELIGRSTRIIFRSDQEWEAYGALLYTRLAEEPVVTLEWDIPFVRKDGREIFCHMSIARTGERLDENRRIVASFEDITERKQMERNLREAEQRYRSIFENAQEGIYRSTPDGKILLANRAMAKMFGYDSPEEFIDAVKDMGRQHYVHPEERDRIKAQIERSGAVVNYESRHYRKDGSVFWVSVTMQAFRDASGQVLYYEGIDEDITDRKESVERLRKALGSTVQAISMAVELKDPYTAGHQRRTADLARAIATEMGLSADRLDFIRIAATIHDIGKIALPAEILSKPTKLSEIEFSLIKTHSQQGYDILKGIDFPWSVADVILQHHERMDGSGYPGGLKGDEILPEAKILSVADVVEAIASHRPYRPAYSIEAALDEIEKNKGVLYEAEVVDACLRLFRERQYQLSR